MHAVPTGVCGDACNDLDVLDQEVRRPQPPRLSLCLTGAHVNDNHVALLWPFGKRVKGADALQ